MILQPLTTRGGSLYIEGVDLNKVAETYGTPCYVYSRKALEENWHSYNNAFGKFPHLVCYAVKANSNLAVLNTLARLGSGFDIVSMGELERVIRAGGDPSRVVFSGVGKKVSEMQRALEVGIRCFNVESLEELDRLDAVAHEMGQIAPVSLRINPDVDAETHPYISTGLRDNKFGIAMDHALEAYVRADSLNNLDVIGLDCHIGSQLTGIQPFIDALQRMLDLLGSLSERGIHLDHLDIGGGLGIRYKDEEPPAIKEYVRQILKLIGKRELEIFIEPGRSIAGNAGVLLTRVEYLKPTESRNFAIVDAAMNDLIRPALYDAWQDIVPLKQHTKASMHTWDVVGPVCETGDFLGKARELRLHVGDVLAVCSAGAYGFSMSSTYNSRPRAAEIMIDGDQMHTIRARESIEDLIATESLLSAE